MNMADRCVDVSVIIPVYNPGPGIRRCLETLRNQTLQNIEMIFVDDRGTDDAMEVVRKASYEDPRIRILENENNMGSGPSRNRGIESAVGTYLAFVDPDDYIAENFLELLYKKAESTGADIVKGGRILIDVSGNVIPDINTETLNDWIRRGLSGGRPLFTLFTYEHWSAVYRRAWVMSSGARYGTSRNSQDTTFLLRVTYGTEYIDFADDAFYYYVARKGSRVRDFSPNRLEQQLLALREQIDFLTGHHVEEGPAAICVAGKIYGYLRLQSSSAVIPGMHESSRAFLLSLRSMVLELPYAYRIRAMDRFLEVFLLYGVNLNLIPYAEKWGEVTFEEYLNAVHRMVDFICGHPELAEHFRTRLRKAFDQALAYENWARDKSVTQKEGYLLLKAEADRLPNKAWVADYYLALETFILTGVDFSGFQSSGLISSVREKWFGNETGKRMHGLEDMQSKRRGSDPGENIPSIVRVAPDHPAISAIVPVYNPGKAIKKCLGSLQRQSFENFEMIFVDDCGTDDAMQIVENAALSDKRIRILRNPENMGAGVSRNRGIEAAKGEYLAFIDSDDYVNESFLQVLFERADLTGSDIVKGKRIIVDEKERMLNGYLGDSVNRNIQSGIANGKEICLLFSSEHFTAIYKRKLFSEPGVRYGTSANGEDTTFLLHAGFAAGSMDIVDNAVYFYTSRINSAENTLSAGRIESQLQSFRDRLVFLRAHSFREEELCEYMMRLLVRQLKLHAAFRLRLGEEAATCFLQAVKDEICSLPYRDMLAEKNRAIAAFLGYNANIVLDPLRSDLGNASMEDYLDMVKRNVDFVCSHPELSVDYRDWVRRAFEQTIDYTWWKGMSARERKSVQKTLIAEADRLPRKDLLTHEFAAMNLYINHGIDTFGIRKSRVGNASKKILSRARKLKHAASGFRRK